MNKLISFKKIQLILVLIFSIYFTISNTNIIYAAALPSSEITALSLYPDWVSSTCSSGSSSTGATSAASVADFVNKYGQAAFNTGKKYGIPYEIILAQGIFESGYAKSELAYINFNFFGLRAYPGWNGKTVTYNTDLGKITYEAFANAEEGFNGYGQFIVGGSRYANALQSNAAHDPLTYLTDIVHDGYNSPNLAEQAKYIDTAWSIEQGVVAYINSVNPPTWPPSKEVIYDSSPPAATDSSSTDSGCGLSGGGLANVVNIARQELNLKPKPYGAAELNDCDSNVKKYTNGRCEAWCADFVSWVYKQAGIPFNQGYIVSWQHPGAAELKGWFEKNQTYIQAGTQTPQPGDVIFWNGADGNLNSPGHVSIVSSVSGGEFSDIGGNEANTILELSNHKNILQSEGLIGFGRMKNV